MGALQQLSVRANQLRALPDLSRLASLNGLDVRDNELASLDELTDAVGGARSRLLKKSPLTRLEVAGNPLSTFPACGAPADFRLRLLHRLPNLATLDGATAAPDERVFSHNLHGVDELKLRAIRRTYFDDRLGTAEGRELPKLLKLYRDQYTTAFRENRNPTEARP